MLTFLNSRILTTINNILTYNRVFDVDLVYLIPVK